MTLPANNYIFIYLYQTYIFKETIYLLCRCWSLKEISNELKLNISKCFISIIKHTATLDSPLRLYVAMKIRNKRLKNKF